MRWQPILASSALAIVKINFDDNIWNISSMDMKSQIRRLKLQRENNET